MQGIKLALASFDDIQGLIGSFINKKTIEGNIMIPQTQILCNSRKCLFCKESACRGLPHIGMDDRGVNVEESI